MMGLLRSQRGMALAAVLTVILILSLLGGLILYLSGKEIGLSAVRVLGAQGMYIAEGGAYSARAALMALMNADPIGATTLDGSLDGTTLHTWYAGGDPALQNAFGIFNFLVLDGVRYVLAATSATESLAFHVNWGVPQPHRKLVAAAGAPPSNALGEGSYTATVTVRRRLGPHPTDASQPLRYIQRVWVPDKTDYVYEFFYSYEVVADGRVNPQARRRIGLRGDYSLVASRLSFAEYALFTHVHTGPAGEALWFANMSFYDGPVHTNGEFRFAYFPKFGTPDYNVPCRDANASTTRLTSAGTHAHFFNRGSAVRLAANENVDSRGNRVDAPVVPDCDTNFSNDHDNPPANFTRGVPVIPLPSNPYSQQGVSIGRDPADTTLVSNSQIRQAVPELANNSDPVPAGIYVPVTDTNADGVSNAGEPMRGGIYVQGNLDSLTLGMTHSTASPGACSLPAGTPGGCAVYTLVQGGQTVTVVVDRATQRTTVTNTSWPVASRTRTFEGVPKGWQGPGQSSAAVVFVAGNIASLHGTLEEKEQTTIAGSGRIDITNHILYEVPPRVHDPNHNPLNVLGIYSANNDIRFVTNPNDPSTRDLDIHGVLMAGNLGDGFNSRIFNSTWNEPPNRGYIRLIGGMIEEYLGVFGVMNAAGQLVRGYGSDFLYDRRMSRGFMPPYFPTIDRYHVNAVNLAGRRPTWREGSP